MRDPSLRLIRVAKEDEGVSICAALSLCNKRSVLLMQNTVLLDSINLVRGTAVEFAMPGQPGEWRNRN
jgi:sulfopyruvate decarboxylase TPP-binding subunit